MEHNHEIFYDKIDFVIDSSTKAIHSIFNNISLAHKDHNSTIFVFQMPRYIGHHDILLCNKVMIHYTNTDVLTKESFPDNFPVIDMHMDPNDEEKVLFSWRVSINATGHIGSLKFSIEFSCVDEEDVIQWSWNTFEHIGISVKNSLHNSNQVPQIYIDVLEQWKNSGQLKDGYTPVRGIDYWTEQDMNDILSYVKENNTGGASSWNDLEDKPFEDNTVVYYEGNDFYENLEKVVDVENSSVHYCKLSGEAPEINELDGLLCEWNDGYVDTAHKEYFEEGQGYVYVLEGVYVVLDEVEIDGTQLSRGIWVKAFDGEEYWITKIYKESPKKLDAKFLPEGTPYTKRNIESFVGSLFFDGNYASLEQVENCSFDESYTDKLTVTLDGVDYEVEKFTYNSEPMAGWGDSRLVYTAEMDINPIDVPFLITASKDYGPFGAGPENVLWSINLPESMADSSHELTIGLDCGKTNTFFTKLYAKPDGTYLYFDRYYSIRAWKDYIHDAVTNGIVVVEMGGVLLYPIAYSDEGNFSCIYVVNPSGGTKELCTGEYEGK